MNLNKIDKANIWHPFSPLQGQDPIMVKKGRGVYLQTQDGRRIIDAISSWWVNIHGHANKRIARAIAKQARNLEQVIFAGFTHEPAIKLSQKLLELLPKDQHKLFFSDDGSTSVEVAIKLAIQYWHNQGIGRNRIIAIEGAYHGDTFGSMSVGDRSVFSIPFFPYLFEVDFVPFPEGDGSNSLNALRKLVSEQTALFIFEPLVQGAAGMRMYPPAVLDQMIAIARESGAICIADEVMTGFGRTGKNFACDYVAHKPDIFCLSKGITGGFLPMGVTTVNEKVAAAFDAASKEKTFFHGHSYTANPIACAAANESLKILRSEACQSDIERISRSHRQFVNELSGYSGVLDVNSTGTILRIELRADDAGYTSSLGAKIDDFFLKRNILLRPLGNVIYMIPPYVISDKELKKIYRAIFSFLQNEP